MRKTITILLIASFSFLGTALAKDADVELTGWPYQVDVVRENLGRFTSQSGLNATFNPFPSNEYHTKMVASFTSGTNFDVVYVRDSFLAEWASAGWIVPITGLPGVDDYMADLPQGIIEQMTFEGEVYGLPYYSGNSVFVYNQRLLKKAGINSPPKTWDELTKQASTLKQKGVVKNPIVIGLAANENSILRNLEIISAGFGGRFFNDKLEPVFHQKNSGVKKALAWIADGISKGVINRASISQGDGEIDKFMRSGTAAFTIVTDYEMKVLNDPKKSDEAGNIKNALVPGSADAVSGTIGYVRLYSITSEADKAKAWKLVQFLGGKDATGAYYVPKRWALEFGLGFSPAPLYKDAAVRNSISGWINPDILQEQAKYGINRAYRFVPYFSDWEAEAWGEFQEIINGSDMDSSLDKLAKNWNELKAEY
ncbi:MAG: extracellular solute-binding protein [Nitrospina sp.]|nr:extracellular solute-binding protein [Nitrospina sp.]